jgi:hypothetical protein
MRAAFLAKLKLSELYRLVDCPMDEEKLKALLVERRKVRL